MRTIVKLLLLFVFAGGCQIIADPDESLLDGGEGASGGGDSTSTGGSGGGGGCAAVPIEGNCYDEKCDGNGNAVTVIDDTDVPDDGNPCTDDLCTAGTPSHTASAQGSPCGDMLTCDGGGQCVGCNTPAQCPGVDGDCQVRTCVMSVCGFNYTAVGTPAATQTPGDCLLAQCDGGGNVENVTDDTDVPSDNNACTGDVCTQGVPSHPFLNAGVACGDDVECDGMGNCVGCLTAADCPGVDDECKTRTCSATGVCGFSFTPDGTALANQTPDDCQVAQCDGNGNVENAADDNDVPSDSVAGDCQIPQCNAGSLGSVADDTDLPPPDGSDCTDDLCIGGVPLHPYVALDTPCAQEGGSACDGLGMCMPVDLCGAIPHLGLTMCVEHQLHPNMLGYQPNKVIGTSGAIVPPGGDFASLFMDPLVLNGVICQASDPAVHVVRCKIADSGTLASGTTVHLRVGQQTLGAGTLPASYICDERVCVGSITFHDAGVLLGYMDADFGPPLLGPVTYDTTHQEDPVNLTGPDLIEVILTVP